MLHRLIRAWRLGGPARRAILLCGLLASPLAAQDYVIIDIGAMTGAGSSMATAINSEGVVVGAYWDSDIKSAQGFIYNSRVDAFQAMEPLPEGDGFVPSDINAGGLVVGVSQNTATEVFLYDRGVYTNLVSKARGGSAVVNAINDAGVYVGSARPPREGRDGKSQSLALRGRIFNPPEMQHDRAEREGSISTQASLQDVNNSGVAVGATITIDFVYPGFIQQTRAIRSDEGGIQELGSLPGKSYAVAGSINDEGKIAGTAFNCASDGFTITDREAFVLDGANRYSLGTLPQTTGSYAFHIANKTDAVVGACERDSRDGSTSTVPFLYTLQDGMRDLNSLLSPADQQKWKLTEARSINELGQIVGTGTFNGDQRAFLLNPITNVTEWSLLSE